MMHKCVVISNKISENYMLRFEIQLNEYDIDLAHKLRQMGFQYQGYGMYFKILKNPEFVKESYLFNIEFIKRYIQDITYSKLEKLEIV